LSIRKLARHHPVVRQSPGPREDSPNRSCGRVTVAESAPGSSIYDFFTLITLKILHLNARYPHRTIRLDHTNTLVPGTQHKRTKKSRQTPQQNITMRTAAMHNKARMLTCRPCRRRHPRRRPGPRRPASASSSPAALKMSSKVPVRSPRRGEEG
jgi:hypothetical protein